MNYIQCKIEKDGKVAIGYIPEHGAKVGAVISMMCEDWEPNKFDPGWIVTEVYGNTNHPEEFVKTHERDFKKFDYTR
jgi:hypothetical protein